jgi:hypothetical protein
VSESYDFNPHIPSTARMYDFYLGGKDNYPADREAATEVLDAAPSIRDAAVNNRRFLTRAVDYCAFIGIKQFIDIGTGIPTYPNVADVARNAHPDAVIVGIDNDPQVLAHDNALLHSVHIVEGDIRRPLDVINDPRLNEHIDWQKPVAVLFVAVLHFVTDEQEPAAIILYFQERMAPGSYIVISHVCSTGADPGQVEEVERIYGRATSPGVFRTEAEILKFFDGFSMLAPGLVPVENWPWQGLESDGIPVLGGVGRKPAPGEM